MKNKNILFAIIGIVLLGAGFGGGYAYAKSQSPRGQFGTFTLGGNGGAVQFSGRAAGTGSATFRAGANGGFSAGEIISKDANGITIKMQDGSSKIILVGSSAQIAKQTSGSLEDLSVGQNVMVTGTPNSDGSITAQTVSVRPAGFGTTTRAQ
jgi:hypothetical protein